MSLPILAVLFSAFLHPFAASFLKKAAHPLTINFLGMTLAGILFSFEYFDIDFWHRVFKYKELLIFSGLFHTAYAFFGFTLLAKHEFQVLYPLTRLAPILVLVGEVVWFSTDFTLLQILGVIILVMGALILGFDEKISHVRGQVWLQILLITGFVAGFHLADKELLRNFSPSEMWAMVFFQCPLFSIPIINQKKALIQDLKNWKSLLGYTLVTVGTWYFALVALSSLDAAIVSSVRNLSILFGVFLGAHMFKEGNKKRRYLAAIFICMGVFFVLT